MRQAPSLSFIFLQPGGRAWSRRDNSLASIFSNGWGGNRFKFFLSPAQDNYPVTHLRLRRISAKACSSGMPVSPEALASSYARMSSKSSSSSRIFSYSSMPMTTATFSLRSFTTSWRSYSRAERRAIQTTLSCSKVLLVVRGSHLKNGEEGFLWDVYLADALHAALTFFLFFEEFAFARNVFAVALGKNILADRRNGLARNHAAANRRLNRHFKHLARNQFSQARYQFTTAFRRKVAMDDQRQRVHRFAGDQHIQFDEVGLAVPREVVIERSIAA